MALDDALKKIKKIKDSFVKSSDNTGSYNTTVEEARKLSDGMNSTAKKLGVSTSALDNINNKLLANENLTHDKKTSLEQTGEALLGLATSVIIKIADTATQILRSRDPQSLSNNPPSLDEHLDVTPEMLAKEDTTYRPTQPSRGVAVGGGVGSGVEPEASPTNIRHGSTPGTSSS